MLGTCPECGRQDYLTMLLCRGCAVELGYITQDNDGEE